MDAAGGHGVERARPPRRALRRCLRVRRRAARRASTAAGTSARRRNRRGGRRGWRAAIRRSPGTGSKLALVQASLPRNPPVDRSRTAVGHLVGLLEHLVAPVDPGVVDRVEHFGEARHAVTARRREVRAGEERSLPSGAMNTVIGQPPRPVIACVGVHVDGVDVGAFLAVDLHVDERSFITAAVASSSKLSCAITWHQWQAA